nr:MAG TPA: hypothetical protein [Caudoviricetes sp.]
MRLSLRLASKMVSLFYLTERKVSERINQG